MNGIMKEWIGENDKWNNGMNKVIKEGINIVMMKEIIRWINENGKTREKKRVGDLNEWLWFII